MPMTIEALRALPVFDTPAGSEPRLVVWWRYPDGRTGSGEALPARQAESMLALYAARFADRHDWLEPAREQEPR
jgi:hypothetical protein